MSLSFLQPRIFFPLKLVPPTNEGIAFEEKKEFQIQRYYLGSASGDVPNNSRSIANQQGGAAG